MSFTFQGEQFQPDPDSYNGKMFAVNSNIPTGENDWSVSGFAGEDPNKGLDVFHTYYASNTGIPGPYRPRPEKQYTPMFNANGVQALFHTTQDLPYSTEDGKAPPTPFPLENDSIARQFNVVGKGDSPMKKEKCGCGGGPLLPSF